MSPKARNGVVDSQLLVYGTKNIRVVDLSIAPLQIAAHSQGRYMLRLKSTLLMALYFEYDVKPLRTP